MAYFSSTACNDKTVAVIHDAQSGHWLEFAQLQQLVFAQDCGDVVSCLHAVEVAVRERGLYAAGFVSYQAAAAFDPSMTTITGGDLPLLWFGLYSEVTARNLPVVNFPAKPLNWTAAVSQDVYYANLAAVKQHIASGATYQVNYSYPLRCHFDGDPWQFFVQLQQAQQGDYGAYLDIGSHALCCASPELFFARCGDAISTRPMKGTAARCADIWGDRAARAALAASEKDRAENVMIVDMLRNDLGRIAASGSVQVDKLFAVEGYPTLWQMTTEVRARSDCSLVELFCALFPCASITGAPKVKTMEIIADLEASARQIYTGSIGFMLPDGRQQFNVAIRTALVNKQQRQAEYHVGGGIIWDSDVRQEFLETQTKAQVLYHNGCQFRLLETLLWEPTAGYVLLDLHLRRLMKSAAYFHIPVDVDLLREQLIAEVAARPPQRYRVRCLVDQLGHGRFECVPQPYVSLTRPLQLCLAERAINSVDPMLHHKTDQRDLYESLYAGAAAQHADVDDVLLFNERGEITETSVANIVVYLQGEWLTPPLHCGVLPGTFRQMLLDRGAVREHVIHLRELNHETLIYTVNSVRGWRWARLRREDSHLKMCRNEEED